MATQANLTDVSRETRRTFLSSDGKAALVEILPKGSVTLRQQVDWVREMRKTGAPALTGDPDATMLVGGIPALNADYETIIDSHVLSVMGLVIGGTLVALLCGFRSLFAAVKAIVLNLISVAAAFGALVLVFQDGMAVGCWACPGDWQHFPAGADCDVRDCVWTEHGLRGVPGGAGAGSASCWT